MLLAQVYNPELRVVGVGGGGLYTRSSFVVAQVLIIRYLEERNKTIDCFQRLSQNNIETKTAYLMENHRQHWKKLLYGSKITRIILST